MEDHRHGIGKTIAGFELIPDRFLALDFGERRFAIPLDHDGRTDPEAAPAHPDADGTASRRMWIW